MFCRFQEIILSVDRIITTYLTHTQTQNNLKVFQALERIPHVLSLVRATFARGH